MKKYRKKPIVIKAEQWFEVRCHDRDEDFVHHLGVDYFRDMYVPGEDKCKDCGIRMHDHGWIERTVGGFIVCPGDYIINNKEDREIYPCKPDIFEASYDEV